jgi:DNA repair photolyase
VELRASLLSLIDVAIGAEVAPGARLLRVSSEPGLGYVLDVRGREVWVDVGLAEAGRPAAARTRRLAFSYRNGADPDVGRALCERIATLSAPREDAVLDALAAPQSDPPRIREVRGEHLLELVGDGAERRLTLSPYAGCLIGCRFCFAQTPLADLRRVEKLPPTPWGSWVDVRINAPEVLRRELGELPRLPVKLCPIVSDPYQAVEERYRLVRACLEVLRDETPPRPVLVLSRSTLMARDLELLRELPLVQVGMSIPTADDAIRAHFEPRAASIDERLALLGRFAAAGVRTFAVVQPLLPGSIEALANALAGVVRSVSIDVLHGLAGAAPDFARHPEATDDRWQRARAGELSHALRERGVQVWSGELPP